MNSVKMTTIDMSGWNAYANQHPPYAEKPTWYEVILNDGENGKMCWWWDNWYQSMRMYDVVYWRPVDENR